MEPGNRPPANGAAHGDVVIVSRDELNRLAVPLTVVRGYAQLLQRRVRRGQVVENEDLFHALERIDEATCLLVAELRGLSEGASRLPPDGDESPSGS